MSRLVGWLWWCEDYQCDCYRAMIERRGQRGGFPNALLEVVWEGEYVSEPGPGDLDRLRAELADKCAELGAENLEDGQYGGHDKEGAQQAVEQGHYALQAGAWVHAREYVYSTSWWSDVRQVQANAAKETP